MFLEQIVKKYGWTDYYDVDTGYVYRLSDITVCLQRHTRGTSVISVPITQNGELIGYAKMQNVA